MRHHTDTSDGGSGSYRLRSQPNHEQWGRLLNTVLDSGINSIDTANDYGVRASLDRGAAPRSRSARPGSRPYSHTSIVGTSNLDHLQENIRGILRGPLSEDVYVESKRRLDAAGETPSPVE